MSVTSGSLRASMWLYPWDVLDEGPALVMHRTRDIAQVDAINIAVTYHSGWLLLPHNPIRRLYATEGGVVYFRADPRHFAQAPTPTLSDITRDADPLAEALLAGRQTGVGVRAWMVCCHNSRIAANHPDLSVRNALGDRLPFAVCPLQEAVQQYLRGLIDALNAYPDLEAIELEALYWQSAQHAWHHAKFGMPLDQQASFLLGLCCCDACARTAQVDPHKLRKRIAPRITSALNGEMIGTFNREAIRAIAPEVAALMDARERGLAALLRDLVSRASVPVRALVGSGLVSRAWTAGIDLPAWARIAPALTVNAYSSTAHEVGATLQAARDLAPSANLVVGLNATEPITADSQSLSAQAVAAQVASPSELSFYHYGLLPLHRLEWIAAATAAARAARHEAPAGA